jgi:hypothetical protein
MGVLSSARFARLARIARSARLARKGSVTRSVRLAFLSSDQPPDNPADSNPGSLRVAARSSVSVWPFAGMGSTTVVRDAPRAAFGAGAQRKEGLTIPVKEGFTEAAAAGFGCWPMMGRARPKMGLAGQRGARADKPSRPAGQMTCGIAPENRANPDLAAFGEVGSMQICLMACLMQQYRCRRGRHETFPSRRLCWWLIWNALTFCDDARLYLTGTALAANSVARLHIPLTSRIVPGLREASNFRALR